MDEPTTRLIVATRGDGRGPLLDLLAQLGYAVVGSLPDGGSLVNRTRELGPDAVVIELGTNGAAALAATRTIAREQLAPVVLIGPAPADRRMVVRAAAGGASAYLLEPASDRKLLAAIELAIARFCAARALKADCLALRDQLHTDRLLLRAKNLVIDQHGLTDEQALARIHELARAAGRSVRDVAEAIVLAARSRAGEIAS